MAGAPRALARETRETNEAIARGVTAMVVGSGALLAFFTVHDKRRAEPLNLYQRSFAFRNQA
jgi:hypothetical protein